MAEGRLGKLREAKRVLHVGKLREAAEIFGKAEGSLGKSREV